MEKITIEIRQEAWPFFLIAMGRLAGAREADTKIDLRSATVVLSLPSIEITFKKINGI
ncbi:MAG: hypothetical protein IID03_11435 [Candidatus Dadabacteria bacterium]|nr:hypothetical protein [Candidatus Dadabacteria bacterium]